MSLFSYKVRLLWKSSFLFQVKTYLNVVRSIEDLWWISSSIPRPGGQAAGVPADLLSAVCCLDVGLGPPEIRQWNYCGPITGQQEQLIVRRCWASVSCLLPGCWPWASRNPPMEVLWTIITGQQEQLMGHSCWASASCLLSGLGPPEIRQWK